VIVMIVLLNVDWVWAVPNPMSRRTFFFVFVLAFGCAIDFLLRSSLGLLSS
jgi:hypothetical protein